MADLCWVDGRLVASHEPVVPAGDGAFREGRGCFTTARWTGRAIRFEALHRARLLRDAAHLGIGAVDPEQAGRGLRELGRAAFGEREGIVRLQASRATDGRVRLVGDTRPLDPAPRSWRAVTLETPHDGAPGLAGAKATGRLLYALAADRAAAAGADEGLLFDAAGRLVEGTRTNLVAVGPDGEACTPPEVRGAVAGVALALVSSRERLARRDVPRTALPELSELVALNAVRGAVPIVEIDGRPVGDGRPGPVATRLARRLEELEAVE